VGNDIPILEFSKTPSEDPLWTTFMGHLVHPDYSHPVFFRHNLSNVNLFNIYAGETVYLIGRGPSLGRFVENAKINKMLQHPVITTYGMNSSPEVLNNNVNLWSAVDNVTKFPRQIAKNPNITKFIPMNRFTTFDFNSRTQDNKKILAYKDGEEMKYNCLCPNMFGVQTYLLSKDSVRSVTFGNAFLNCPAVLYGMFKGHKCVLLYAIKICLLLGFKKIVLIGVDFSMDPKEPYYKQTAADHNSFHVQHNNRLYDALAPMMQEIVSTLHKNKSQYRCKISTAEKIPLLPFIPKVDLAAQLAADIARKTK